MDVGSAHREPAVDIENGAGRPRGSGVAREALELDDAWVGFSSLFSSLASRCAENAGLSGSLAEHGGPVVAGQRRELLKLARGVIERAQREGRLRQDLTWQDVVRLVQSVSTAGCVLGIEPAPRRSHRAALKVVLDGLRSSATTAKT